MSFRKKELVFIINVLFLFALAACAKGENPSMGKGTSGMEPTPPSVVEKGDPPIENNGSGEVTSPKKYDNNAEAYLNILAEKYGEIRPMDNAGGKIAIVDVLGDETPELLYTYGHEYTDVHNSTYPVVSLKIFTYSKSEGVQSVFDSIVFIAAGGPNNYCVYLSRERELILYRSDFRGGEVLWGFWQINPNQNIEISSDGNYCDDSAKLFYLRSWDDEENNNTIYKKNGEEISKEQYDENARELLGDIDHIIFQNVEPEDEWDVLWKDISPLKADNMTYDEAVAWLEAQIGNQ